MAYAAVLLGISWKHLLAFPVTTPRPLTTRLSMTAPGDDDDDDEDKEEGDADSEEEKLPSCGDYIMHFITVFWKLLFAFVPPTGL